MAPDLDVFPRVLRYVFLAGVVLFVAFALLLVLAGVTSA
jgi:SNF family Na+-dependent transporter